MTAIDIAPKPAAPTRRQALKILAATAAVPLGIAAVRWLGPDPQYFTWTGTALGGLASLTLWHSNPDYAAATVARMLSEVQRLETVFSLFLGNSEISRLNRDATLPAASSDLRIVLETAQQMGAVSGGSFDVSVQPLWDLYARHFAAPGADPAGPSAAELAQLLPLIDFGRIAITGTRVSLAPGMAITLNSIAQGYITDRVADLLRNEGFDHVVVELGETRVLGSQPDGQPWNVGIRDGAGNASQSIALSDRALSVSGGYGTVFEPSGQSHHIFNPGTGRSADGTTTVAVTAARATIADGLSTAILVAGEAKTPALLAAWPGTSARIIRADGTTADY